LRQLCPHCKSPASEPLTPVEALFREVRGQTPGARATGCEACGYTGYIGRFPVVEVVEVTEQVRSQLLQGEFDADSLRHGMPESWRSIEENAANWVISGLTTAQEAYANLGQRFWNRLAAGRGQALPAVTTFDEVHGERQQPVALIVTPDQRLSSLIGQCLTELGFANHLVDSGTAAASFLKRMRQTHFIVVDGRTPHGDARPLLRDLSSSLAWSGLPAVVIYDPDQKEVANLIIEHTGTDGVPTPIDPGLLRARIRGLLSR
jgi:type IV pilus assembly protein PilB